MWITIREQRQGGIYLFIRMYLFYFIVFILLSSRDLFCFNLLILKVLFFSLLIIKWNTYTERKSSTSSLMICTSLTSNSNQNLFF